MSCFVPYDSLQNTLLAAYRSDFNKFKELSAVIGSVMGTSLSPEAKIHAVWFYAGFVDTAAQNIPELQTQQWSDGAYRKLHNYLKPFLNGEQAFDYDMLLGKINELLAPVTPEVTPAPAAPVEVIESDDRSLSERINDAIAETSQITESDLSSHVNDIIKMITDNAVELNEVVLDPQTTAVGNMLKYLKEVLSKREDSSTKVSVLENVNYAIDNMLQSATQGSKYFDLAAVEGISMHNGYPIKIVTKPNGENIQVVYSPEKGIDVYWSPGTQEHLEPYIQDKSDHATKVFPQKDNLYVTNPNTGALRIQPDQLFTGVSIPYENDKIQGERAEAISQNAPIGAPFQSSVTVRAHTNTVELNASRVERLAQEYPDVNRTLETMERPNQREMLRNGNGPIITLYRPVSGFTIRINDQLGNNGFDLDTLANLAIVYPDNSVVPFDINNTEHVNILRANVETKTGPETYGSMTDNQFEQLKESLIRYKAFEKEVMERMEQENSSDVDIKDIFNRYYNLSNNIQTSELISDAKPKTSLREFIEENDGSLPVMLQSTDQENAQPYSGRIYIVLRKQKGVWTIESTLPKNTVIVGRDGTKYRSIENYLKSEGVDYTQEITSNFGNNQAVYLSFQYVGNRLNPRIIPLMYDKRVRNSKDAVDFASSLVYSFMQASIKEGNTATADLNNILWGFDVMDDTRAQFTVLKEVGGKKTYGIRFFGLPELQNNDPERAEMLDKKGKNYDIEFSSDMMNSLFTALDQMIKEAGVKIPENASVKQLNMSAMEAMNILGSEHALVKKISDLVQDLSADIKRKYAQTMTKHDSDVHDGDLAMPIFTSKFKDFSMFDGNIMKVKRRTEKTDILDAYDRLETNDQKKLTVTANESSTRVLSSIPNRLLEEPMKEAPYSAPIQVPKPARKVLVDPTSVENPLNQPVNLNEIDEQNNENPFSLVEDIESFLTLSNEDFSSEIQAMKDLMPDAFTFVSTGLNGMNVDGHVLGYMQDMFIYLNETLRAKGVAYHEGFHGIFRKVLSKSQQDFYLNKVEEALGGYKTDDKGKYISVRGKKIYANDFRQRRKYGHLNDDQIRFLIYEEYLADSFADFMGTNKVPRTWMQKLFAYLKKLLNLFKKGGRIDNLFYDISLGKFRNAPIIDNQGPNMEKVYSLDFRGIPMAYVETTGKVITNNQIIGSEISLEVKDFILQGMAALSIKNPDMSASQLFDLARMEVLKMKDINTLISQSPEQEAEILAKYGEEFATARWLLGAMLEGETFTYRNLTNAQEYDNQATTSKKQNDIVIANLKRLKSTVIEEYNKLEDLEDVADDENFEEDFNKQDEEVEIKDSFYEGAGFVGIKPNEGNAAFRRMIRLITYEEIDPVLGIKVRRMVNSALIFSTITKIASTESKGNAIQAISDKIQELDSQIKYFRENVQSKLPNPNVIPISYDKAIKLRDSLKAVYDTIDNIVGLNEDFEATRNEHVLKQFSTVFSKTNIKLIQAEVTTEIEFDQNKKPVPVPTPESAVSDIVTLYDINKIRSSLRDSILSIDMTKDQAKPHLQKLRELAKLLNITKQSAIDNMLDTFFTDSGVINDHAFRNFIDDVYITLSAFNLDIPYSLLYNAIGHTVYMAMGKNLAMFPQNSDFRRSLSLNKDFFQDFSKVKHDFWYHNLVNAIEASVEASNESKMRMNNEALTTALKRFTTPYVAAYGEYIIKHDPTIAGSSTKNANGDTIYKYVDPNKEMIILQKLKSFDNIEEGLAAVLNDGFEHFYENNPMLDTNDPEVRAFLQNMRMEVFAGFQQRFNMPDGGVKMGDPRTFKDIDDAAFLMSMLSLFVSQERIYVPETKSYITSFKRILTVYEATGTSMVTNGVLRRYFDNASGNVLSENGRPKYLWDLVNVLKQEYELIRTNYEQERTNDANTKKYLNYNINSAIDEKTGFPKDRGFRFNVLADFADANPDLAKELIMAAKEGLSFDAIMASKSEKVLVDDMLNNLHKYAQNQYVTFRDKFQSLGLDETHIPLYVTDVFDEEAQVFQNANPTTVLREFFFNNWINSLSLNQIFDGPVAVGVKNFANFFKRQKAGAAAGPSLFNPHVNKYGVSKTYRAAVIKEIVMYLDDSDLTKPASFTPYYEKGDKRNVEVKMIDGQSYNTIARMVNVADSRGRLDNESYRMLKRMMYETEDTSQYAKNVRKLNKRGIVFNSLKTVTAGRIEYVKQSEHTIMRKDVSTLKEGVDYNTAMQELDVLYDRIMDYSYMLQAGRDEMVFDPSNNRERLVSELYKEAVTQAHSYFEPIPQHAFMHHMLNSMELHRIDQMFDPNASKKMTINPVEVDLQPSTTGMTYYNLDQAVMDLPNEFTFIQVSTEKDANMVTQGIQQKLLLAAQIAAENPEYASIKDDINTYNTGLAQMVKTQLKVLQRMFNTKDTEVIGKIYQVISAGLKQQGADSTILQYFELNPNGSPKYNPNLMVVQSTIANYFFSIFNNNLFDKKIAGRKYYHVSSMGYNVIEMDGKVITTSEYKRNKSKYDKAIAAGEAKVRPLSYTKTKLADGTYKYEVEVIIPKELQSLDQEFLEKYMSEFFATRIPTEGQRSMIVAKVVDYMDEAYGSGIIVPPQAHMLAGSDFDIDALYAHVKSSYRTPDGKKVLYGDYSHYIEKYDMSEKDAKFMEYLVYLSKDPVMQPLLQSELRRINYEAGYKQEQARNFGSLFGGKLEEFFSKNASTMEKGEVESDSEQESIDTFKRVIAVFNVLEDLKKSNLPSDPDSLEKETKKNGSPVIPLIQNKILQAKMNILSNEAVYKKFMEESSNRADVAADPYKAAVSERGLSETEIYNKQNIYTPTAMVVARGLNSESKDSLGIAASFNKGVSMLATVQAELKGKVGTVYEPNAKGNPEQSIVTDKVVDESVKIVGGYIGVAADAANNPYPGPLHLNSHTVPVMLAMFTVGMPQRMAIMFQSLPIIQKIVAEYTMEYGSAYKKNPYSKDMRFDTFLRDMINELEERIGIEELLDQDIMYLSKTGANFDKDSYKLVWNNQIKKDDPEFGSSKDQPLNTFGFELYNKKNIAFTRDIEDFIILNEFKNYSNLASEISFKITKLTDALKSIKPDMDTFDRLVNTFDIVRTRPEELMLSKKSIQDLFQMYPVLRESYEALKYMDNMSSKVLLERTSLIKGMSALIGNIYGYESSEIRKDIKAFIGLQLQRAMAQREPESFMNKMFLEQVNPETFLNGDVIADYNQLKSRYPGNKFIQALRIVDIGTTSRPVRVLEAISSKLSPEMREMVYSDLLKLLGEGYATEEMGVNGEVMRVLDKERAFRIAYHGMVKSGAQKVRGGFFELVPAVLSKPMSTALDSFQRDLVKMDNYIKNKYDVFEDVDGNLRAEPQAEEEYLKMLTAAISKNFGQMGIDDIIQDAVIKIVSMKLADGTMTPFKRVTSLRKISQQLDETVTMEDMVKFFNKIAPANAPSIIDSKGLRVSTLEAQYKVASDEYELFTGVDGVLFLDLADVTQPFETKMLRAYGITPNYKDKNYRFPLYRINIYGQLMMLKRINGNPVGQKLMETLYLTPFTNVQELQLTGETAVYEVVPEQGVSKISPLAFTSQEAAVIKNIVNGIQQISDTRMMEVPRSMTIVREQNRMYELRTQKNPSGAYTNKTMSTINMSIVETTGKFSRFKMVGGELFQYLNNEPAARGVKQEQMDLFAQRVGFSTWGELSNSERFKDFVSGKENLFLYELNNGDPTSPTAQPLSSAPTTPQVTAPTQVPVSAQPAVTDIKAEDITFKSKKLETFERAEGLDAVKGYSLVIKNQPSVDLFVYKDKEGWIIIDNTSKLKLPLRGTVDGNSARKDEIVELLSNTLNYYGKLESSRKTLESIGFNFTQAPTTEKRAMDIVKLNQQAQDVLKQKEDESRNCNGG